MKETSAGEWRVVGASAAGPSHASRSHANEDAWACRRLGRVPFVIAVADGAGSAPYAATGARLAVEAACRAATHRFDPDAFHDSTGIREHGAAWAAATLTMYERLVRVTSSALDASAATPSHSLDDFATTLLAVVVHPPFFYYLSAGDCYLILHRQPGGVHLVVPPDRDDLNGATAFLNSTEGQRPLRHGLIADGSVNGLAICTDGLIEATLDTDVADDGSVRYLAPAEFADHFRNFADPARSAAELAVRFHSPEFAETSGDDKTMVLAVRQ